MRFYSIGMIGLVLSATAIGCMPESPEDTPSEQASQGSEAIVSEHAFVLEKTPGVDVQVDADRLTFPAGGNESLLDRKPGDVLLSGRGTGFLRKVVSVSTEGDSIVVSTEPAGLGDVFVKAHLSTTLGESNNSGFRSRVFSGPAFGVLNYSIGKTSFFADGNIDVQITGGNFQFDPSIDFDLDIDGNTIKRFTLIANGQLDASLGLKFYAKGKTGFFQTGYSKTSGSYDEPLQIANVPLQPLTVFVGPVPVVIVPKFSLIGGFSFKVDGDVSAEGDASLSASVTAGAKYNNGNWTPVGKNAVEFQSNGPVVDANGSALGKISVIARLTFAIYDLAGPFVSLSPYTGVKITKSQNKVSWNGLAGLSASYGCSIINTPQAGLNYTGQLFDWSKPFGQGSTSVGGGNGNSGGDIDGNAGASGSGDIWDNACKQQLSSGTGYGSTSCNMAGLKGQSSEVAACVKYGGGKGCFTAKNKYPYQLCGEGSGGGYTCNLDKLYSCLCNGGGSGCFNPSKGHCKAK